MQFVQSFRFNILPMYDCCHIDFFDQSFFLSFPISASQPTASPLRRRNAISLVCVYPPLCSGPGCCFCWNFITWSRWNNCVHLYSWIQWRPSMFRTPSIRPCIFKSFITENGQAGKLLPDDMEGWHSERNCTCVAEKQIATWVPSQMH